METGYLFKNAFWQGTTRKQFETLKNICIWAFFFGLGILFLGMNAAAYLSVETKYSQHLCYENVFVDLMAHRIFEGSNICFLVVCLIFRAWMHISFFDPSSNLGQIHEQIKQLGVRETVRI